MHISVLKDQAIAALQVKTGELYVDCTFGGGGHSRAIAALGGQVIALDADPDAMARLNEEERQSISLIHANFENVEEVVRAQTTNCVAGVLFDLGLSSFHLADQHRGFSFQMSGPLDMRFNPSANTHTAGSLIDALSEEMLVSLFRSLGEEPHSLRIAKAIKQQASQKGAIDDYWKSQTTAELAGLIERVVGRHQRIHPATRVFQALRMAVNDELGVLQRGLDGALHLLCDGGSCVVISFHSLEDRVVKQCYGQWQKAGLGVVKGDLIVPAAEEVAENSRSRSAKMRVFVKGCK